RLEPHVTVREQVEGRGIIGRQERPYDRAAQTLGRFESLDRDDTVVEVGDDARPVSLCVFDVHRAARDFGVARTPVLAHIRPELSEGAQNPLANLLQIAADHLAVRIECVAHRGSVDRAALRHALRVLNGRARRRATREEHGANECEYPRCKCVLRNASRVPTSSSRRSHALPPAPLLIPLRSLYIERATGQPRSGRRCGVAPALDARLTARASICILDGILCTSEFHAVTPARTEWPSAARPPHGNRAHPPARYRAAPERARAPAQARRIRCDAVLGEPRSARARCTQGKRSLCHAAR